jgi:hypothetical protein
MRSPGIDGPDHIRNQHQISHDADIPALGDLLASIGE